MESLNRPELVRRINDLVNHLLYKTDPVFIHATEETKEVTEKAIRHAMNYGKIRSGKPAYLKQSASKPYLLEVYTLLSDAVGKIYGTPPAADVAKYFKQNPPKKKRKEWKRAGKYKMTKNILPQLCRQEQARQALASEGQKKITLKDIYKQLASYCGVTVENIEKIKGGTSQPNLTIALKISHFFNMSVNEIFFLPDDQE